MSLRILLIGRFYTEGVALFIADELERMGHSVTRFDPAPALIPFGGRAAFYLNRIRSMASDATQKMRLMSGRDLLGRRLLAALDEAGGADLVVSTHDYLSPADVQALKAATDAPVILWFPDPVWSFRRHMFLNAAYDLLLFKDPYLVHMVGSKLGKRTYYMPECYCPHTLDPRMAEGARGVRSADLTIAGNLYAYRVALFEQLADHDLKIWGLPAPPWMQTGPLRGSIQNRFVAGAAKVQAFRSAKIVLNSLNPAEIWGTNVRTFEACGAGAFQLVDWRPGLGALFEIGRELDAFTSLEDLQAKIRHYLANPADRAAIASAGQARARRDHTYRVRLGQLLATVDGTQDGYPMPELAWNAPASPQTHVRVRASA